LASELGIDNHATLTDTANFSAWTKLVRDGVPGDARVIDTMPPTSERGSLARVLARTRARHTRSREQVEQAIGRFLRST
jgi:hypothetical protein